LFYSKEIREREREREKLKYKQTFYEALLQNDSQTCTAFQCVVRKVPETALHKQNNKFHYDDNKVKMINKKTEARPCNPK